MSIDGVRLRFTAPFTVLPQPDLVHLVAGEDLRFALRAPGLERWLPALLAALDGARTTRELLAALEPALRDEARALLEQLLGERVLVDARDPAPEVRSYALRVTGHGALFEAVRGAAPDPPPEGEQQLRLFCQDALDWHAAREAGLAARRDHTALLWVSAGPAARGLVGPVLLPDEGPCMGCLFAAARRLSPAPELLDALVSHAAGGQEIRSLPFAPQGRTVLAALALWKAALAAEALTPSAVYALHVLDVRTLEVREHPLAIDEDCPDCGRP